MTSKERHEIRYQRRKAKRLEKRKNKFNLCGSFEDVFSFENLYSAGKKCMRGVLWKTSSQNFIKKKLSNTYFLYDSLIKRKFKFSKPYEFTINERGKIRKISSQKINERIMQRTLCDKLIVPIYDNSFIYDNAANRVGKGIDHTLNRVHCHMQRHFRKYGLNGWIVTLDIKDFFNSALHDEVYKENSKRIFDKDLRDIANKCMEIYGDKGFGLGAHTSQIYTSIVLNPLDHYIKDKLKVKCYGRYVDDFYFFAKNKEEVNFLLNKIKCKVESLGLCLSKRKIRIYKFANGFRFLKTKFICLSSGKVIRKMNKKSATRMRRKLRKFKDWIIIGKMSYEQVVNAYYSFRGHLSRGNSYLIINKMDEYFNNIIFNN